MSWETELDSIFGNGVNKKSLEKADAIRGAVDVGDLDAFDEVLEKATTAANHRAPAATEAQKREQARQAAQRALAAAETAHQKLSSVLTEIALVAARVTEETIGLDPADAAAQAKTKQAKQQIQNLLNTL